jgi:short-subunit dehydrogenase
MANSNKYALITGATSGIGYELAKLFAEDQYNLVIVARTQEDLDRTASELSGRGIEVVSISKDLSERNAAFELYEEVKAKGIQVDVLVNDAGQGLYGEFVDTDIERELYIIQLNISSLVVATKLFLKDMVERGEGKILNLASIASRLPGPLQSVYHATKAFVLSFSEAIRNELKDSGITVTALMPGATDTDFFAKADMLNAKNVAEGKLDDATQVAKDGYKALMSGDDKVVSGLQNKAMVSMSNITPDPLLAERLHKMQAPVDGKE